jgi:hypothetical protein
MRIFTAIDPGAGEWHVEIWLGSYSGADIPKMVDGIRDLYFAPKGTKNFTSCANNPLLVIVWSLSI